MMKEQFLQDCQNLTAETWPADTLVKEKTQSQLKITSVQRSMSKLWLVCKHIKEKKSAKKDKLLRRTFYKAVDLRQILTSQALLN